MGWLFGRKKKKKKASSALHDDQSLSFGSDDGSDTVIKPDRFKAAAGVDTGFPDPDHPDLGADNDLPHEGDSNNDAWGQMGAPAAMGMPEPAGEPQMLNQGMDLPGSPRPASMTGRRLTQDYKYLQVLQYKRILGELSDLDKELSHMGNLSKSLDKAEYNEEKHFMRLKETMRKAHDKVLMSDRILFSHSS